MTFVLLIAVLAAGAATPLMSGSEAELNGKLVAPIWCAIVVYASCLLGLGLVQIFVREPLPIGKLSTVPWWAWIGGLLSLGGTLVALTIAQKMGAALFTGASITASLVVSLLLDNFGWVGFKQHAASPARLAGAALMIAGLWVVAKF